MRIFVVIILTKYNINIMKTALNFDYSANRGKQVSVTGKKGRQQYVMIDKCNSDFIFAEVNEAAVQGFLIGLCPDDTVILDIKHPSGIPCICEIDRLDIKAIVLDEV